VRWVGQQDQLAQIAADPKVDDDDLRQYLEDVLADEDRPGTPPKFSAEDVAAIVALACEDPVAIGLPFSHWSARDLQQEVLRRQIVSSISVRQIGRFFKRCPAPAA
jgi:putative transposase